MAKNNKNNSLRKNLYTNTAEPLWLRDVARMMTGLGKNTAFCTKASRTHKNSEISTRWWEANLNPVTQQWDIFTCSKNLPAGEVASPDLAIRRKGFLPDLCLFDALHYCAYLEKGENDLRRTVTDQEEETQKGISHYKDFAKEEGIPLDTDGMPHPPVKGRIVTEGNFLPVAYETAEKRKDEPVKRPVPPSRSTPPLPTYENGSVAMALLNDNEKQEIEQKIEVSSRFHQTLGIIKKLETEFNYTVKKKFNIWDHLDNGPGLLFAPVLGGILPIIPLAIVSSDASGTAVLSTIFGGVASSVYLCIKQGVNLPRRAFKNRLAQLNRDVARYPEGPQKDALRHFSDKVEMGFHILWARQVFRDAAVGKKSKSYIDRALKRIEKIAVKQGWEGNEITELKLSLPNRLTEKTYDKTLLLSIEKDIYGFSDNANNLLRLGPK